MIRIYLDWNIISSLKRPEFNELKEFIEKHKKYLQFPYSPAHFTDLMKSYHLSNDFFYEDLDTLEYLSEKHLLRWGGKGVEPLFATPKEYFETEKDKDDIFEQIDVEKLLQELDNSLGDLGIGNIGSTLKSLLQLQPVGVEITKENEKTLRSMFPNLELNSSMWDLMKEIELFSKKILTDGEYYKNFRKSISDSGFKLDRNSGNWNYTEVVGNIDKFLESFGTKMTYLDYVESSLKYKKEPYNYHEFFTMAYLLLDMIGYKTDKLPKQSDNMQNIQADGEHSFYGGHCDYFVAIDKKLRIKSQVLYNEFNIPTIVLHPSELIGELEKVIDSSIKEDVLGEVLSFCIPENLVESYPLSEENKIETYAYKLPKFYFNYFNYVIQSIIKDNNIIVFTFRKAFKNYSRFIYFTEPERLIDSIVETFGGYEKHDIEELKRKFVYEDENNIVFEWRFEDGIIRLQKEEDTRRPILNYIIYINKKTGPNILDMAGEGGTV